ncbi:hypothetical protein SAMN04488503_0583 [Humidesulfovibrio mexicanus]|uniref:Phosphatidylglycerol lysyltransferase C-terminal domain-containing protein n=1 Tax=Humidesulfovibrio mexicanus TaxID=147047 RepID=A0A238Y0H4_9BACT|nr:phosphatidylglycerol lysyltransferase domain-containing protein [Humidesulfovibrio mexicanus]SNR64647.1 hypothetical protein SAMN04488503_0583 [Humidesulfovibrio mexicanus]
MTHGDTFDHICLKHQEAYRAALAACPQVTSDYAFANLYGWTGHYGLGWRLADGLVWIRQSLPKTILWAPVGDWAKVDWAGLPCMAGPMRFTRVPEMLVEMWAKAFGSRLRAEEARDHFDYVYSVPELMELKGNRFHKKKNLLNQFEKANIFEYTPMQDDCVEEVLDMQAEWHGWQEHPSEALEAENEAISRVLKSFDRMGALIGGTIRVAGKVIAYTVGEQLDRDTIVIHFEKGDTRFKGVYQAINKHFLAAQQGRFTLVNREQDLGDEGLRKAKLSYNPVQFMKKYEVELV